MSWAQSMYSYGQYLIYIGPESESNYTLWNFHIKESVRCTKRVQFQQFLIEKVLFYQEWYIVGEGREFWYIPVTMVTGQCL